VGQFVRWFEEISLADLGTVGGKNASLGELTRELGRVGVRVPGGFAVTASAYHRLLDRSGVREQVASQFVGFDATDVEQLARRGNTVRECILAAGIPDDVWEEIVVAYDRLCAANHGRSDVAVRSSATAEDLPTASFAGQQESFLNVAGYASLRVACTRCYASLFTDRAISYRARNGFDPLKVALSIGVQTMVRSDLASSGVIFTLDTETGFRDVVQISAAYGLGENVVQGLVDPDEFIVFKPTLATGHRSIVRRRIGTKQQRLVYESDTIEARTRNVAVSDDERTRFCISDDDALHLARQAVLIEQHYARQARTDRPMDIEWAKDGRTGEIFIVQARPETVHARRRLDVIERYLLGEPRGPALVQGRSVGTKIATGRVRAIADPAHLAEFMPGEILVAESTAPDWEPVMKRASAIVTTRGGRTAHAAIVAREIGVPAVVGATDALDVLATGREVTVSCAEGEVGTVYDGAIPFHVEHIDVGAIERPRTKIMINLADPSQAFAWSFLPNDGVGLARMEFIVSNTIRIHPMALVHPERVHDLVAQRAIAQLTAGYSDPQEYFVRTLADGVATIAAAFHPKPVIVRMSDFKSNEYARLIGGAAFEAVEENPMIGFRGAARYAHPAYAAGFALECRAMRVVREEMGLTNLQLMIPFCRTVAEGERALAEMAKHGLVRGQAGLKILVMCEIPNNVIRIDAFAKLFDGISIGSNDLTQLVLGVDRDSQLVASEFDERDPGVLEMLRQAVRGAARNGIHSGICGQAPSDHPEIAEFLVRLGIDAISLTPDTVVQTTMRVLQIEKDLVATRPVAVGE